jgi:hypothetical protein
MAVEILLTVSRRRHGAKSVAPIEWRQGRHLTLTQRVMVATMCLMSELQLSRKNSSTWSYETPAASNASDTWMRMAKTLSACLMWTWISGYRALRCVKKTKGHPLYMEGQI